MDAGTLFVSRSQELDEPACAEYFKQQHQVCKEGIMMWEFPFVFSPYFPLGRVVIAEQADDVIKERHEILQSLQRHALGDWGDIHKNDIGLNEEALVQGGRLLSVYYTSSGTRFWIITEADRSATTVLLPEEY